jgi:hypothetical protein
MSSLDWVVFSKSPTAETPHEPLEFSSFSGRCWQLTLVCKAIFYLFVVLKVRAYHFFSI